MSTPDNVDYSLPDPVLTTARLNQAGTNIGLVVGDIMDMLGNPDPDDNDLGPDASVWLRRVAHLMRAVDEMNLVYRSLQYNENLE